MRRLFSAGYFGSWLIMAALVLFVPIGLLWEMANVSHLTGVDDDVTLLALPMGAALGAWAAVRTRRAAEVHRVFSVFGILCMLMGTLMANWFLQRSERATGLGPFAGFGELIGVGMSIGIVAIGACIFGIWAFAKLARFGDADEHHNEHTNASDA
jgi:hypothetical protein